MENKNWYAVITADLLYNKDLKDSQKLLMAVISNMSNERGYCFASNSYLAELMNTSVRSIQRGLNVLEDNGFLGRVINLKPNGEVDYRALTPLAPMTKTTLPHVKSVITPHDESVIYNNKYINNKDNNKTKQKSLDFIGLLDFLNSTLDKNYRVFNSSLKKKYMARIKEGYLLEDFKNAMVNASRDAYHKETNYKYLTIEYFSRCKTLDLHGTKAEQKSAPKEYLRANGQLNEW